MSRLFTFGCSYTNWPWPTWADILAHELKIPHENWALPGIGNISIANRMLECDLKNNFTDDDFILVVWSSWTREDRFKVKKAFAPYGWNCLGDVHYSYDKDFIDNHWSLSNDLYKNSTAIIQANRMFDLRFNGHITYPIVFDYADSYLGFDESETNLSKFFEPYIPNDGLYNHDKHTCNYKLHESHPDVMSHLNYTLEYIMPKLNLVMSTETIEHFTKMDQDIHQFAINNDSSNRKVFNHNLIEFLMDKYNWTTSNNYGFE